MASESSRRQYRDWYERHKATVREKKAESMRRARAEDPERHAKSSRESKRRRRERLFQAYGRVCTLCGFDDERALTLDHVLNNGAEERAQLGPQAVYLRALRPEYRSEYRILCMNCQFITRAIADRSNQWVEAERPELVRRRRPKVALRDAASTSTGPDVDSSLDELTRDLPQQ